MRYVTQLNMHYNKYQSINLFYLYEPDIVKFGQKNKDYVLGITYQVKLPDKYKNYKNMFEPKFLNKDRDLEKENNDTY